MCLIYYFFTCSGPFRWTEGKNTLVSRDVFTSEPFLYKIGSKEAGQKWTEVAGKLNSYSLFKVIPRDQRSVREHYNKLLAEYKRKKNNEEKASGITPDSPTENEKMLEDIIEIMNSTPTRGEEADSKRAPRKYVFEGAMLKVSRQRFHPKK